MVVGGRGRSEYALHLVGFGLIDNGGVFTGKMTMTMIKILN